LAIEFTQYLDSLPWAFAALSPALVSTGPEIKIAVVALDDCFSKGGSMRKSVIRLLVAVALVVSGNLMPVYAANSPFPTPALPPVHSN
jgi:hypothetical protein